MEKTIYNLKLHEKMRIDSNMYIMRVASGWLYSYCPGGSNPNFKIAHFVPFDNKFQIPTPTYGTKEIK